MHDTSNSVLPDSSVTSDKEIPLDDLDDEELDTYILTEHESNTKSGLWHKQNATYLEELKSKSLLNL